jgi:Fic family protein
MKDMDAFTGVSTQGTAVDMAKRLVTDSIWKSANLEGLGTTFPKVEAILANAPTETKMEEVLFVINMKRAWNFLLSNLDYNNCIELLVQFNKVCGVLLFSHAGEIRKVPVRISGTTWEPEVPNEIRIIDELVEFKTIDDPVTKALEYFCYVARTQMFLDGNKRVAQLIANKVLIENNIGIFQIPIEKLEEFRKLLIGFYETGDNRTLMEFLRENCVKYVR